MLELARALPRAAALAQLDAVRAHSLANGFPGQVLACHLYAAETMTGVDAASARHHARAALALAETHDHDDACRAELRLICGKALLFAGTSPWEGRCSLADATGSWESLVNLRPRKSSPGHHPQGVPSCLSRPACCRSAIRTTLERFDLPRAP